MTDGVHLDAAYLIGLRPLALGTPDRVRGASGLPGGFVTRRQGHGQEMADIRAYVVGDDIRYLDPSATARTGELHVRTYHDERDRTTLLVADMRPSMLWGLKRALLSVAAAEALVLIGWQAVESGGRVGLAALTGDRPDFVRPRGRTRGMLDVVSGLVRAHARALEALEATAAGAGDEPLDRLLGAVDRVAPTGGEVVIASAFDTGGPELDRRLADIGRRCSLRLLAVGDAAHRHLPAGLYPIASAEGRRVARVDGTLAADFRADTAWPALPLPSDLPPAETAALLGAEHGPGRA
jgi:uncharacterized protein (DUF58 family)